MAGMLYQEELMDHYRNPRNRGVLAVCDFKGDDYNPSCGDRVSVTGTVSADTIDQIQFSASGCVLSQAAASMLSERCKGKTISAIMALNRDDMLQMVGIELGPTRLKCALLCLHVLQEGLRVYAAHKINHTSCNLKGS